MSDPDRHFNSWDYPVDIATYIFFEDVAFIAHDVISIAPSRQELGTEIQFKNGLSVVTNTPFQLVSDRYWEAMTRVSDGDTCGEFSDDKEGES